MTQATEFKARITAVEFPDNPPAGRNGEGPFDDDRLHDLLAIERGVTLKNTNTDEVVIQIKEQAEYLLVAFACAAKNVVAKIALSDLTKFFNDYRTSIKAAHEAVTSTKKDFLILIDEKDSERRQHHNAGATKLQELLRPVADLEFQTARGLFYLISNRFG